MRKHNLTTGQTYHIFSRSIAGYVIFNSDGEYSRMLDVFEYYVNERPSLSISRYLALSDEAQRERLEMDKNSERLVDIIAYCIMPTHIHLVLKQLKDKGIVLYMKNILNSYSRYFNTKHIRKGPLWEGRFKSVLIEKQEYLQHLTRYVHLNPVTSKLTENPSNWKYSSYNEYLNDDPEKLCRYADMLEIDAQQYKTFVEDRIAYQQELHQIKSMLLE